MHFKKLRNTEESSDGLGQCFSNRGACCNAQEDAYDPGGQACIYNFLEIVFFTASGWREIFSLSIRGSCRK